MIYVDINLFRLKTCVDLKMDETMTVNEMLNELQNYYISVKGEAYVFSKNLHRVLIKEESFENQGITGGDTLIIIDDVNSSLRRGRLEKNDNKDGL